LVSGDSVPESTNSGLLSIEMPALSFAIYQQQ
jgi:hypothetical protein